MSAYFAIRIKRLHASYEFSTSQSSLSRQIASSTSTSGPIVAVAHHCQRNWARSASDVQPVLAAGEEVELIGVKETRKLVVTGVEMFKKLLDEGQAGDNVGCLIRGIEREEIERGQVLAKSGSIKPHTKFSAQVYVLTKEEGGRHTPFYNGYRPQFYLRTTDVTGAIGLPDGAEMIMPGDNVEMTVELITPIALEVGQRFAIREGGRTVGAGAIVSIQE